MLDCTQNALRARADAIFEISCPSGFTVVDLGGAGDSFEGQVAKSVQDGANERGDESGSVKCPSDHIRLPPCRTVRDLAASLGKVIALVKPDLDRSWFVGDNASRIRAANAIGVKSILVESGRTEPNGDVPGVPEFTVPGIEEAVRFIETGFRRLTDTCGDLSSGVRQGDVVLVGGLSRSGKTTFANGMKYALAARGLNAQVLSIDRFLKNLDARAPGVIGRYDVGALEGLLSEMLVRRDAKSIALPVYDKLGQRTVDAGERMLISAEDVMIVEGTIALTMGKDDPSPHRFYIEIDEIERRRRVIDEYLMRGRTPSEAGEIYASRQADETPIVSQSASGAKRVEGASLLP